MRTGIASVPSPRKKAGVKKVMAEGTWQRALPDPHQPLTARQVTKERLVERFARVQQRVVDPMIRELRLQRVDVRRDQLAILPGERLRHDRDLLAALEILEARRIVVPEIELRGIEDVKDDQIVAEKLQRLDRVEDVVGLLVEVRDQHDDAAALEE